MGGPFPVLVVAGSSYDRESEQSAPSWTVFLSASRFSERVELAIQARVIELYVSPGQGPNFAPPDLSRGPHRSTPSVPRSCPAW
jgi:hypothetical protein